MNLGPYIKELREAKNMSQRELADLSNISNAEISRLENGERKKPSINTIKAISPYLGVDYKDLLLNAGYIDSVLSSEMGTMSYLDTSGKAMDILLIAKEIYKVDPDILKLLKEAISYAPNKNDIDMIKRFLTFFTKTQIDANDKNIMFGLLGKFV